ncbi:MAG: hypothetical protein ACJ780_27605 [Solirubrobacteraceae bacterium]
MTVSSNWRLPHVAFGGVVLVLALLAAPASAAVPQRFWLSPSGSDANAGTEGAPFASLPRAQRAVRKSLRQHPDVDVEVILRGGVYRLRKPLKLTWRDSARDGHSVVYRADKGERPIISGGERVPGSAWSPYEGSANIWRARVGKIQTRELYVNGQREQIAATDPYPAGFRPSWNDGGPDSGIEYLPTIQPDGLNPPSWGDPTNWTNVPDIQAVIETQWKMMSVPLRSVTPAEGSTPGLLHMVEPAWTNANLFRGSDGQPGVWSFWQVTRFVNALQFLDSPGEWYLDSKHGWLYYEPYPGEDLKTADVELPLLRTLVNGHGQADRPIRNIGFQGLTFAYATWLQPSGNNGYVSDQAGFHVVGNHHQPNRIGHDSHDTATPGEVAFRFARGVQFVDDHFKHLGSVGLSLGTGSQDDLVKRSTFTDIGSSGLQLSGIAPADHDPKSSSHRSFGNSIVKNVISHVGREYPDAPGIFSGFASGTRIVRNLVENVPWSGIALGWGWGLLDPGGFPGLPGATQYQWGRWDTPTPNRDGVVAHNTVRHFLRLLWDGGGIYTTGFQGTDPANGLRIESNVIYDKRQNAGGNSIYTDGGSRFISVRGNTLHDNPIGVTDFGPPPRSGDPLPYPSQPSEGDGLPYGSDIGGCVTYGDIRYARNSWFEAPMEDDFQRNNDIYAFISGGALRPYSADGFFDVCPYRDQGVSYPTNLTFSGNVIYPATP